ncbi:unnamed protein product [Enterobius vermicularis]|uniref:Ephrin RBD domain-containing protein n=1 Tax=Enterobius vermicularis TaxID=51028 RepID=A0A0N4V4I1_ENTVE|nr:unnamed protein product [Enterobius vermicularis]
MDSLVIHCPTFNDSTPAEQTEQLVIYRVSKFGYDKCVLHNAQVVGRCSQPYSALKIRTVFREFTPLPNGLEYEPGKSYYFISTSDGSPQGMDSVAGGLCTTKNMKLKIHIHNYRHSHTKKRNYHTSTSRSVIRHSETTKLPAYWDEFLHKFSKFPVEYRKENRLRETVALDSNGINENHDNTAYEHSDGSFSQALRLNPTSILYEIHEFDESKYSEFDYQIVR